MISGEAATINFRIFHLTRPGIEPTIYRIPAESSSAYTTDAVCNPLTATVCWLPMVSHCTEYFCLTVLIVFPFTCYQDNQSQQPSQLHPCILFINFKVISVTNSSNIKVIWPSNNNQPNSIFKQTICEGYIICIIWIDQQQFRVISNSTILACFMFITDGVWFFFILFNYWIIYDEVQP